MVFFQEIQSPTLPKKNCKFLLKNIISGYKTMAINKYLFMNNITQLITKFIQIFENLRKAKTLFHINNFIIKLYSKNVFAKRKFDKQLADGLAPMPYKCGTPLTKDIRLCIKKFQFKVCSAHTTISHWELSNIFQGTG